MNLAAIDYWVGKTLFVPPIIKLCQLTRQSQFAIAKLLWFIAALDAFYRADSVFSSVLWGGMSLFMMVSAARRADYLVQSLRFFRLFALALLIIDLVTAVVTRKWAGSVFWLFVLIAEYAATILTLPPKSTHETIVQRTEAL